MDDISGMSDIGSEFDSVAVVDDGKGPLAPGEMKSPVAKTRSLSDGGTPKLSPSPHIFEANRQKSKDDIGIRDKDREAQPVLPPSTPIRAGFSVRGLSLQLPRRDNTPPAQHPSYIQAAPLSPKLDHSHTYASPTNILPRRSRGLDFSRAATSLHHSTLAEQASPDSSPTIGSRAMNIPGRRNEFGTAEQTTNSLWSMMGNQEKMHISSSLGSNNHIMSDTSSSSDDDDFMDEDMDDAYVTTPQVAKPTVPMAPWMPGGSPAVNSLLSFQQRQRQRKQNRKKKLRGPIGVGFHSPAGPGAMSKSPPGNLALPKEMTSPHARRESISWAANQLHISGNDSDDNVNRKLDGMDSPSRPGVIRRAVTRRGNLLPKTKGFARIRAALAEEGAPIDTEVRREAEVVRQVRESDMDLETRFANTQTTHSAATTALSSPNLGTQDTLDELVDDIMMMDSSSSGNGSGPGNGLGLAGSSFNRAALKNSKGKLFWDGFPEGAPPRITPPPPSFGAARASSSGLSADDISMDSPSASSNSQNPFALLGSAFTTTSSSGNGTPQPQSQPIAASQGSSTGIPGLSSTTTAPVPVPGPPTAAEITRRINSKRRRDDDFDPVSFKRRAVSPGMSAHNSPVMQSPLQRDMAPWGSRPGSVGGDTVGKTGSGSGSGAPSENGSGAGNRTKGRIGFQGMVDTNDGITRLSIE
ncbi:hypothetical protein B0T14DRAFT_257001 [Immersiella caudata]|uniref:Uncharacterized protein n=1 Tax=Immersiella caudata TaxID=314043 RepID=A0AA39WKK8_9PEZI|nr:hypothetical protein B0T14DRAFT_257001 [Immersiella caudata]